MTGTLNGPCRQVYDVRKNQEVYTLTGHTDTPTSLALSPNGGYLLSPSFSSQTIIHDVRPFSPSPARIHRVLQGAPAGFESALLKGAWSKDDDGRRVAVGGADRMVCIWEVESGRVLYKVCPCVMFSVMRASTYAYVASRTQGDRDVGRFPSKRTHQCVSCSLSFEAVCELSLTCGLTGSFDRQQRCDDVDG